jgi:hypothetical protein
MDNQGPNIFPLVEGIDVRDAGRTAEVILATKVEGQLATLTIRLSYAQAARSLGAVSERLGVWSPALMAHSYRMIRRMRYGTSFTRLRHHDGGNPSSNTK